MKWEEMRDHENKEVKKRLKEMGYQFDLYVIDAVLEAYADFMEEELPEIDTEEADAFILDNLTFDPECKEAVSRQTLDRIDYWRVAYMKQIGLIPEDMEEDDE